MTTNHDHMLNSMPLATDDTETDRGDSFAASITGALAVTIVSQARAALADETSILRVDRAGAIQSTNEAPEQDDTSALMEQTQRENRKAVCPACGVAQADHWMCACCSARGHHIPRSTQMPAYCDWCVQEGCAQRHHEHHRTTNPA